MVNPRKLAFSMSLCPLCDGKRIFIRLDDNEISIRCLTCKATAITLSLVDVLQQTCQSLNSKIVYELSSRGPLVKFLKQSAQSLVCSEYFDDVDSGSYSNGVQCQDVQALTYPDEGFDVCTSTEVFEHVADDLKGFSEVCRVLKPTGIFVFTVPIDINSKTVERALQLDNGEIQHVLPPEYHGDSIRGNNRVLAFRNYGYDILERLVSSGFSRAELRKPRCYIPWGYGRTVVVAYREAASNNCLAYDPYCFAGLSVADVS